MTAQAMSGRGWRALPVVAVWLVVLAASVWVLAARTSYVFDITRFLPRDDPAVQILQDMQASGSARLILIGIEGGDEQRRAAASLALAAGLQRSELFSRVENGAVSPPGAQVRALFEHRYLLSPTVEAGRFSEEGLRRALQQRLQELSSPLSMVQERVLPADPTGEAQSLLRLWLQDRRQPETRSGVWASPDGGRAVLLAETRAASFDVPAQQTAVAAIRDAFATAAGEPGTLQLLLGGPGVLAAGSQDRVRGEAELLSTLATVFIVLLLTLSYRSPRAVVLSVLPLASAILVGAAATSVAFGWSIHGITLGFGCTLLGICVDYPIVLMSLVRGGRPVREGLRRVVPMQRLCALLTVIGYLALLSPAFPGLSQVGVFSAVGLITAMVVTHRVLPALLPERWDLPAGRPRWRRPQAPWLRAALRPGWRWSRPLAATAGLAAAALLILHPPAWEDDIAAISPVPRTLLATDQDLRKALRAPEAGHVIIIRGADVESVLQKSETVAATLSPLVGAGALRDFVGPSHFLPSAEVQLRRQAALPESESLREVLGRAASGLPFRPGLFEPFLADVERARTSPPVGPETLRGTPIDAALRALLFPRAEGGWTGLITLSGVANGGAIADALSRASLPDVRYLSVRQETRRLMAELRAEALWRLAAGAVVMILVLAVAFRSLARVMTVVLPVALALLIDLAVLTALGQRLSLLHLISMLLVAGLAVDYAIVFSKTGQDADFARRALQAMALCCATTLITFGMLAVSSLPVLQAIGSTVVIGVGATFALAVLLARPRPPVRSTPVDIPQMGYANGER